MGQQRQVAQPTMKKNHVNNTINSVTPEHPTGWHNNNAIVTPVI